MTMMMMMMMMKIIADNDDQDLRKIFKKTNIYRMFVDEMSEIINLSKERTQRGGTLSKRPPLLYDYEKQDNC